jgi:endonuclease G
VYDTDDADDTGLLGLLNAGQPQVNENGGGNGQIQSSQRCPNGTGGARNTSTYQPGTPTPGGVNTCAPPPTPVNSPIVISQLYGGGGNQGATYQRDYVELFNRSLAAVDITGWSLQYASASGSGWEFTRQPLGGSIGPGEYLLIALASGAVGAELPPANINGFINMSGTSGKVALVDSFEGLVGNCPLGNPHLMDLVGYGAADCREGVATAPSPSNTTAIFRRDNGATDTNQNGADFITAVPSPRRTAPIVELGPMVLSTDPRTNGFNAPRDATIEVMFTEPVDVVGLWFDITCAGSGPHNDATVAPDGLSYFITPNVDFTPGEQCTVTVFKDQIHDQDLDDIGPNTDTLLANYSWSFTVATGTPPPDPPSEHLVMGNPTTATADLGQPNNYLMSKPEYALSYSRDLGRPNWVSWHLSDEWIGSLTRVDSFRPDPRVPPDWYRVQTFDFTNTGFNRGHVVPNADRDKETSIPINQATFLMTNMLAQSPDNNQGPWGSFEAFLRTLLPADEIYLVAGGAGTGGTGENGGVTTTSAHGHVTVPAFTWKVALVLPKDGGNDLSRVSCSTRTIAVIMPNTQGIRNNPWEDYLTTVDAVEALTGYDLFSSVPPPIQFCIEAGINGNNPPPDTTPPTITLTTPVQGATYLLNQVVNAAFSCSDGGSGTSTCIGTVANGAAIDTTSLGTKTFTVSATDAVGNLASSTVSYDVKRTLTAVGPAKIWLGLANSDDVGLRVDLRTELLIDGTVVAAGDLLNVSTGSSGFNNAILQSVSMALTSGAVDVPSGADVSIRISVRRTCSGGGHNSGRVRAWFNGQPVDGGPTRDAGTRLQVTVGGQTRDLFLRPLFLIGTAPGNVRLPVDQLVGSLLPCSVRPYLVLGVWRASVP